MPNSILFGNGINRLSTNNQSWDDLLQDIKDKRLFDNGALPYTMIYERILFERPLNKDINIRGEEFSIKERIANAFEKIEPHIIYKKLFELQAHNYISTNYDYAFRKSISKEFNLEYLNKSTEEIYSIRRKIEILNNGNQTTNIWHIHGEIDHPKTIMLGLDHYCGEIGKIDNFIKGKYEYIKDGKPIKLKSIEDKLLENKKDEVSWVELFFFSNIHVIGFSFDFSEIDLWWILTKRARLLKDKNLGKKIKNKIYFYCNNINSSKEGLFKSVGVEVIKIDKTSTYDNLYLDMIDEIEQKIAST